MVGIDVRDMNDSLLIIDMRNFYSGQGDGIGTHRGSCGKDTHGLRGFFVGLFCGED